MRSQVGRVVAAVAVVGAVVSGCAGGPSQFGSAAIVGSDAIPLDAVQEQITAALSQEEGSPVTGLDLGAPDRPVQSGIGRQIVTDAIRADLLDRRVAEEGLAVSESQIDAAVAAADSAEQPGLDRLYTGQARRDKIRDDLLAAALGARFVDRLGVTLEGALFESEQEARDAARAVAAGDGFTAGGAQVQRLDVRASDGGAEGFFYAFGSPAGSAIVLSPLGEGQPWRVVRIVEARSDLAPNGPSAVDRIAQSDLQTLGYQLLQPLAGEVGVRVNPRYGVWDALGVRVADPDAPGDEIVLPAAAP